MEARETIVAAITGLSAAMLGWAGFAYRIISRERRRQEDADDRLAGQKLSATGEANLLLFNELKEQIRQLRDDCSQLREDCEACEKGKAELWAHLIAQQSWIVELRIEAVAKGMKLRDPPLISATMLAGRPITMEEGKQ